MKKNVLHEPIFHILLIAIICFLAYSNTFQVPFQLDDKLNIVENPVIKKLYFFVAPSKAKDHINEILYHALKTRYMGYLSFAMNYKIQGLNVTCYHIFNTAIHIINAALVYWLVFLTFKTPYLSATYKLKNSAANSSPVFIAFFSALLFASHPVQTQAVTYVVQRFTSLATMFYLLSLAMYIKWRFSSKNSEHRAQSTDKKIPNFKSLIWYLCSICSTVLAMKTKEIAFTLPIIILLYEFMFFEGKVMRRILYLLPLLFTMLIIPLSLMSLDKPFGELISDVSEAARLRTTMSRLDYLFTEFRVIMTYIRLIFLPINQNLDYDYQLYHSFFNLKAFLSFTFLLSLFGLGVYLFYRYRNSIPSIRMVSFGIFWFFITLSVESSIIPIVDAIFEHRVYLPSIGVFFAINTSLFVGAEKLKNRWKGISKIVVGALAVIVIVLTGATYARNSVWKDEVSLWEDVVRKSPNKARAHQGLGYAYQSEGLIDKAIEEYWIAIKLDPDVPETHNNLGFAYKLKGLIDKAIEEWQTAIKLDPSYQLAHGNLGNAYKSKNRIDEAIEEWQIAIELAPYVPEAHYNLGIIYQSQGLIDKAIEEYQIAIRLDPDLPQVHSNLGVAYKSQGLIDKAIEEYQTAIKLNPDILEAYYNLGIAYQSQGIFDKAAENYNEAIRLKPDWETPHFKLGLVYFEKGDTEKAEREFVKVLQINPQHNEAQKFLNLIVQRKNHL